MLAILGTLLTSVMSGGATGLLGIMLQRFFDVKAKGQEIEVIRLNHANAVDLKRVEIEAIERQSAGNLAVAVAQREAVIGQAEADERSRGYEADSQMLVASIASDRSTFLSADVQKTSPVSTFLMALVDFTRGMTRPALTLYLVVITHLMFNWVRDLAARHGAVMTALELKEITMLVLSTILYLATVAVVWWFGTRPPRKAASTS